MQANHRGPIYAAVQAALRALLTPDERRLLDAVLDKLGVPRRPA